MDAASVPNIDLALLNAVVGPAISCASVHGMLVVQASACRVDLVDLIAHLEGGRLVV